MNPQNTNEKPPRFAPRWSLQAYKATLISLVALAFIIPLALVALPFIEFFNGMAAQPKGKTQMTYGRVFGEAIQVDRPPVAGTLPQGFEPYAYASYGNTIDDAKKVGELLQNPLPYTKENMQAGEKLYNTFCIVCHGKTALGDGSVTGANRFPAPPSLHTDQARGYADGTIFHILTKGMGKMPNYADKLDPNERWQVIQYLRAVQRSMNPRPEDVKP
jgi:hypothetical protein